VRNYHFSANSLLPVCILCLVVAGCSGGDHPKRYRLTGAITFDGKPVPSGWIIFAPEHGPGASANIEGGRYETPEGFGSIGGMHTIEVFGFDGVSAPDPNVEGAVNTAGKAMFTYTFKKDIPKETTTWDIHISRDDLQRQSR